MSNQKRVAALNHLIESIQARVRENNVDLDRIRALLHEIGGADLKQESQTPGDATKGQGKRKK